MGKKELIQDSLYRFPYHHIPSLEGGSFSQTRNLYWGHEYFSYLHFVIDITRKNGATSLLDVGCGDGKLLNECRTQLPGTTLTGIDTSERAVALAKALVPQVEFVVGDIGSELEERSFDAVSLVETFEHVDPAVATNFLGSIAAHMHENSVLIVTVPTTNVPLNPKHYRHFDVEIMRDALLPYFEIREFYFLNRVGFLTAIIQRLLSNRLFILNERHLVNALYAAYKRFSLIADSTNGKRLCVVCKKKVGDAPRPGTPSVVAGKAEYILS